MPRRQSADPLSRAVGKRIKQLREEAGLTLEKLAYESALGSKGHLSSLERGLVRPTIHTLKKLVDRLDLLLVDLVNIPEDGLRQKLLDLSRFSTPGLLRKLVKELEGQAKKARRS